MSAALLLLLTGCGRTERDVPDASGGTSGAPGSGGSSNASQGGARATGGVTGLGGAPGSGGAPSEPPSPTSQVDLLLMIDNSISMADKQQLLSEAMTQLITRLAAPNCVDARGEQTGATADASGSCAQGSPEFSPVNDLHVGIVTSSLGAHGGQTCAEPSMDDRGQLLPTVRAPLPGFAYETWNGSGFLAWDPEGRANPAGEADLSQLNTDLQSMVASVGQTGCGYEASLEAWYRFLIDPDPPSSVPQVTDVGGAVTPVIPPRAENVVLQQRAAFLRRDSALVIVMLSDENDCSIRDEGQGWLVGTQVLSGGAFHMPSSTSACAENPNDRCCASCASAAVPGCPAAADDPACAPRNLTGQEDNLNLRCWDQKRRFGFDLLYPVSRYVDGLTNSTILGRDGTQESNPVLPRGGRTPSMIFLTGIVGVPWQDLATERSLEPDAPLEYLSLEELTAQGRWSLILGSPGDPASGTPPVPPGDKLMVDTPLDRSMLFGATPHPLLGASGALAPASMTGRPNPVNGHESNIADFSDLQYACIFPLPVPRDCAAGAAACDCKTTDVAFNRPICDRTTQTHAKAYPGLRELEVLKHFGELTGNAIPASICPKAIGPSGSDTGYGPVVSALVGRLKTVLR